MSLDQDRKPSQPAYQYEIDFIFYNIFIINKFMKVIKQGHQDSQANITKQYARLNNSIIDNQQIISNLNKRIDRRLNIGYYCQVQSQRKSLIFPAKRKHTFVKKIVHKPYKKIKQTVDKVVIMVDGEMNTDEIDLIDDWQNTSKIQVVQQPDPIVQDGQMQWSCDVTQIQHKNYSLQWQEQLPPQSKAEIIQCCDASVQYDLFQEQLVEAPPKIIYIEVQAPKIQKIQIKKQHVQSQCDKKIKQQYSLQFDQILPQTYTKNIQIQIPDYKQLSKINAIQNRLKYLKMKNQRQREMQKKTQQKIEVMKLKEFIQRLQSKIHLVEEKGQYLKSKQQIKICMKERQIKFQQDKKDLKQQLMKKYNTKIQEIIKKIFISPKQQRFIDRSYLDEELKKMELQKQLQHLSKQELIDYRKQIEQVKEQLKREMFKRLQYENDITQESQSQNNQRSIKNYYGFDDDRNQVNMNNLFPAFKINKKHVGSIVKNVGQKQVIQQNRLNNHKDLKRVQRAYWRQKSDLNYRYSSSKIQRKQRKLQYIKRLEQPIDILISNPQVINHKMPNKSSLKQYNPAKSLNLSYKNSQLKNSSIINLNESKIRYDIQQLLTMTRQQMQIIRKDFQQLFKNQQLFKYLYSEVDKIKLAEILFKIVNIPIKSPKNTITIHNYHDYIVFQYKTHDSTVFLLLFHGSFRVQYGRTPTNHKSSYQYYKNVSSYKNGEIFEYIHLEQMFNGFYVNGIKHGYGILSNILVYYEGQFTNGKKQGKGKMILQNGDVYRGQLKDNKFNGQGKYKWKNGQIYDGFFCNGLKNGFGKHYYSNKDSYQGMYKLNKKHGKGIYKWKNGSVYEGQFQNDYKNGPGKLIDESGHLIAGVWKNDQLVEVYQMERKPNDNQLPAVNNRKFINNK